MTETRPTRLVERRCGVRCSPRSCAWSRLRSLPCLLSPRSPTTPRRRRRPPRLHLPTRRRRLHLPTRRRRLHLPTRRRRLHLPTRPRRQCRRTPPPPHPRRPTPPIPVPRRHRSSPPTSNWRLSRRSPLSVTTSGLLHQLQDAVNSLATRQLDVVDLTHWLGVANELLKAAQARRARPSCNEFPATLGAALDPTSPTTQAPGALDTSSTKPAARGRRSHEAQGDLGRCPSGRARRAHAPPRIRAQERRACAT